MDLYDYLAYLVVATSIYAGTFMAIRGWRYRKDRVLLACFGFMSILKYAVAVVYILVILNTPALQAAQLTVGAYIRPLLTPLIIMPCVLLKARNI